MRSTTLLAVLCTPVPRRSYVCRALGPLGARLSGLLGCLSLLPFPIPFSTPQIDDVFFSNVILRTSDK
jgi:hypothetical protein